MTTRNTVKRYTAEQIGKMPRAALLKAVAAAESASSATCRAVIAEGGGNLRHTDMLALRESGKASAAVLADLEAGAALKDLRNECERRKAYRGDLHRTSKSV